MSSSDNYYDALAESYQEVSRKRNNYLEAVDRMVDSSIRRFNPKRLLDIGSGDGKRLSKLTKNYNIQVWALENSNEMCTILSNTIPISRIFQRDVSFLPNIPETFDLVTALWNVFGHIESIGSSISDVKRKLNNGGVFIFDVNNPINVSEYGIISSMRNWWKIHILREQLIFVLEFRGTRTDVYFRSLNYYKSELERAGFSKIQVKYINYSSGALTNRFRGQLYFECM